MWLGQPNTAGATSAFVKSLAPSGGVPEPHLYPMGSPVLAQAASPWEVMHGSPHLVPPPRVAGTQILGKVWESACVQVGALNTAPRQGQPTWLRQGVALMALVKASETTGVLWRLSREQQEGYTGVRGFPPFLSLSTLLQEPPASRIHRQLPLHGYH